MLETSKKIDFWIENNQNVLFIGKHGCGKTSLVKEAFEKHNLNYRYFSASTMDPWVDFVGVPKENTSNKIPEQLEIIKELTKISVSTAETWVVSNWNLSLEIAKDIVQHSLTRDNGLSYLELVRPYSFASGEIEALFFDEFNRSPKKVRNAVMELIQFKSINGFKFPKLRLVWAAINPEDEEETYDVEKLDPAQRDRFHISVNIPYSPNVEWFRKEYGKRIADSAIQWWNELPEEEKDKVSPRRLQYALDTYKNKGDIRDVLPSSSNVSKLNSVLNSGPTLEKLEELIKSKDVEEAKSFLSNENNYSSAIKYIIKSDYLKEYFLPLLSKEKIAVLISEDDRAVSYIVNNCNKFPIFKEVCEEIIKANTNTKLVKKIRKTFTELQTISNLDYEDVDDSKIVFPFFNENAKSSSWKLELCEAKSKVNSGILESYKIIEKNIPQKMLGEEAVQCLEILSELNFQINDMASSIISPDSMIKNLLPIINHCIVEACNNRVLFASGGGGGLNPISIKDLFHNHLKLFHGLITKIKLAGYFDSIITTEKQLSKFK